MTLTAEQQKKVEQNIRLVRKVINDKIHGPYQLGIYIHTTIFFRSAASASARLRQQTKAEPSLPMPIA